MSYRLLTLACVVWLFGRAESTAQDVFDQFPWLSTVVDRDSCSSKIEVYDFGEYSFVVVETTDELDMYFETGQFYCSDHPTLDCKEAYLLTPDKLASTYNCTFVDDTEDSVDLTLLDRYPWLEDHIEDNCSTIQIREYQLNSVIYITINFSNTDGTNGHVLFNQEGDLWCTSSINFNCSSFYKLYQGEILEGQNILCEDNLFECRDTLEFTTEDSLRIQDFLIFDQEGPNNHIVEILLTDGSGGNIIFFDTIPKQQKNQNYFSVPVRGTYNYEVSVLLNPVCNGILTIAGEDQNWCREDVIFKFGEKIKYDDLIDTDIAGLESGDPFHYVITDSIGDTVLQSYISIYSSNNSFHRTWDPGVYDFEITSNQLTCSGNFKIEELNGNLICTENQLVHGINALTEFKLSDVILNVDSIFEFNGNIPIAFHQDGRTTTFTRQEDFLLRDVLKRNYNFPSVKSIQYDISIGSENRCVGELLYVSDKEVILENYPWTSDVILSDSCSNNNVSVYKSDNSVATVLIQEENQVKLYSEDNELLCVETEGLDCIESLSLNDKFLEWNCVDGFYLQNELVSGYYQIDYLAFTPCIFSQEADTVDLRSEPGILDGSFGPICGVTNGIEQCINGAVVIDEVGDFFYSVSFDGRQLFNRFEGQGYFIERNSEVFYFEVGSEKIANWGKDETHIFFDVSIEFCTYTIGARLIVN